MVRNLDLTVGVLLQEGIFSGASVVPSTSTTVSATHWGGSVKAVGQAVTGAVEEGVKGAAESSDPGLKPCPLVVALLALALVTMLQLRGGC